ncbi:MAG: hypothetical protein H9777_01920 [Candidatus Phocaeicola faecigallinarum]|uniref:DUF1566 domain-containing protein n=1 Tax=Candidatus Phocaeicola faecigallinarum TaxID=2838732 RepID=A0A948WVY6_9BACT|nr:hypothetical protein [Candidatus Phocaeicola faecigallinarum]
MKKILFLLLSINIFLSCKDDNIDKSVEENHIHEGHEYVDLGLPSGALWATLDVTVNNSVFFSWGETDPKQSYMLTTYQYLAGADSTLTKYCTDASCGDDGFIDGKFELQPADDVAHANWGGNWLTPTWNEWEELYSNCTWKTETDEEGVCVFVGTSKINGKQIRFKGVGAMQGSNLLYAKKGAYYWSSTLISDNCMYANGISFSPSSIVHKEGKRPMGHCVRAIIPGDRSSLNLVDLGLPSKIKWARTNIGAVSPEDTGLLYAWGECAPKPYYDFTNYKFCNGTPQSLTKYCTDNEYGTADGIRLLDSVDDVASQLLGEGWRMPTVDDLNELIKECTWTFETINDQKGFTVVGPNGNSIFLPFAGTMWQAEMEYKNIRGFYWSSTLDDEGDMWAEGLFVNQVSPSLGKEFTRASGRTVRPVHD